MQDFDVLREAGVNEVTRGVGKTARIELVRQWHTIDEDGDTVAADAANVDAFRAEARSCRLVVNAGDVTENVCE